MPPKKPRYVQEIEALEAVLVDPDDSDDESETARLQHQLDFYRRLREAVFVNAASSIDSLDEAAAYALRPGQKRPPIMDKPVLLLPALAQQRDAAPPIHSLFTPGSSATKRSSKSQAVLSKSPQHKKQRTAKHKKTVPKSYRVQMPTGVPRDVRNNVQALTEKADEQGQTPTRLAYPWVGQRAWYPPSEFPDLHRLHYEIWMPYREVQWLFALYAPCSGAERRRKAKAEAKKARLILLSACVETFGYYGFLQRFEDSIHDNLMWFGGTAAKHSATATRVPLANDALQEDLVTLFKRKDKTAYRRVIARAMDPYSVDENGYTSIPELLEQSGALDPTNTSYLRLTTRALACIVMDAKKSPPTESWVGSKQTGVWKKLLSDRSVLEEVKKIRAAKKAGLYEPDIPTIDYEQDDADSEFEDENGQYTALPPSQPSLSDEEESENGEDQSSEHESEGRPPPPNDSNPKKPLPAESPSTSDPPSPVKSPPSKSK
ncbi:hypothetical protein PHMEG_00018808 [Phytophthora megakarya]|uniref:Uncharacterized protein n=1 Tax=Phytophthora megakarya TaxID=4795 RepID=A0A225VUF2_9STRA|nr:hypothetical protein PHMEG_00018808 [Phytophthora megakarya]